MGNQIKVTYVLWVGVILGKTHEEFKEAQKMLHSEGLITHLKKIKIKPEIIIEEDTDIIHLGITTYKEEISIKTLVSPNNIEFAKRMKARLNRAFEKFSFQFKAEVYHNIETKIVQQ